MARTLLSCIALFVLAFALAAQQADDPIIKPGDHLTITTNFLAEQPTVSVQSDGMVNLPLLGKVKAEGISLTKLLTKLKDAYAVYIANPTVTARLTH